jgi:hypothetical protein
MLKSENARDNVLYLIIQSILPLFNFDIIIGSLI